MKIKLLSPVEATAALDASAATARQFTGLVLPFGKPGRTSRGKLTVTAGAVSLPEDITRVKLFRDHSDVGGTPVGRALSAEIKDDGIYMSFEIGDTPDGQLAVADVTAGIRDALSVELIDVQIEGETLTAAALTGVALVPTPAYDAARITSAFVTADTTDDEDEDTPESEPESEDEDEDKDEPRPAVTAAETRNTLTTRLASNPTLTAAIKEPKMNLNAVATSISTRARGGEVTAALQKITEAAHPAVTDQQWLGELFDSSPFERQIVPTLKQRPLSRMKLTGWRWTTRPEVDDYSGNLTEIPSNAIATEPVEVEAKRISGGHKIDRKYLDFADTEFIESYLREMTDSYKIKTDEHAAKFLATEAAKSPAAGGKQPTLLHAAAKAQQVIKKNLRKDVSTFLVNPDDLFKLFDITMMDDPRYLALFNVNPETFISDDNVPAGTLIAYHKDAIAWGELPGSPIRVDALDVALGGQDRALFGYWAALVEDARGLTSVAFGAGK